MVFVLRNQYSSWRPNGIDFLKLHTNFIQNTNEKIKTVSSCPDCGGRRLCINCTELKWTYEVNMNNCN